MPPVEPPEGFECVIPFDVLSRLHLPSGRSADHAGARLSKLLENIEFPAMTGKAPDPLFDGTMYFVRIQFTIKNQNNTVISVSAADVATAVSYATLAVAPISQYAAQYGPNSVAIDPGVLSFSVTLPNASYNDSQLQGWVNTIAASLPKDSCVVVLNPEGLVNTDGDRSKGIGGYHSRANVPYIFANLYGANLTVADPAGVYAQILSHEIAETVVDPSDGNPEVCDACAGNCNNVVLSFFDANGKYIANSVGSAPATYSFFINAIVKPGTTGADGCALTNPGGACNYAPPLTVALLGCVAVGSNKDGRLEVFGLGLNTAVYHNWQVKPNGGWSGWNSLNGALTSDPSLGCNADGRLELFARGKDSGLWHIWQQTPNGTWSGWNSLGGIITSDPAVYSNADGRLEVFARGSDNGLWHIWQLKPNGNWSPWSPLGGVITSDPVVYQNADGRMEVFARGTDNALWHIWQTAPNGGWSGWSSFGGVITSAPAVGRNADGRLEAFARGADNAVWHIWQVVPNGGWSGWNSLGGIITSDPSVNSNADGRLEVFSRGLDNGLWHIWQTKPNGGWSGWASLGGVITSDVTVGRNADGRLEAFARGLDDALWHNWQVAPNGNWSGWSSLGGVFVMDMAS